MDNSQTGCPLCNCEDVIVGALEPHLDLEYNGDEGVLFLFDGDSCIGHFEIKYCPMCGRKLVQDKTDA